MSKITIEQAPTRIGTAYPSPYDAPCLHRHRRRLGDAAGLTQFGVNLTRLPAGTWSSQRHWHTLEDEFIYVVEGELVLVTNSGEQLLRAGDCAGFKAGNQDAHQLQNRSEREAVFLEVGTRTQTGDEVYYPDIDLHLPSKQGGYLHRDGTPYEQESTPRKP